MTSKPSKIPGHQRSPKAKPRSFGEQWTAKGDAFTRAVSEPSLPESGETLSLL